MKSRKIISLLLVLVVVMTVLTACGGGNNPDNPGSGEYTGAMVDGGNTYADSSYLPVVKNPINLEVIVRDELLSGRDLSTLTLWDEVAETTGVRFNIQLLADQAAESLVFASRNYPDVAFRLYDAVLVQEACLAGDIIEITDEMIENYAPNWLQLFEDYPDLYSGSKKKNGKLYSLPNMLMEEHTYMLRDAYAINTTYLDELGLDMPTTTDEFLEYLRAVKAAAGTGSIPDNVAPIFIRFNRVNIGSYYSILDWFGVYGGFDHESIGIVADGEVRLNAQDPNIKEGLKYIAQLKKEELVNVNAMKGDYNEYTTMQQTKNPGVGAYFTYSISDQHAEDFAYFEPMKVEGRTQYVRAFGFNQRLLPNTFMIFANCKNPIAALRAVDTYAAGDRAIRWQIGEQGENIDSNAQYYINDEGEIRYTNLAWKNDGSLDTTKVGINNYVCSALRPEYLEQLNADTNNKPNSRAKAYYELYKKYETDERSIYPVAALALLTQEEYDEVYTIKAALDKIVGGRITGYINGNRDIDDDWDTFQEMLDEAGIDRMLELMQKAYDAYTE